MIDEVFLGNYSGLEEIDTGHGDAGEMVVMSIT